MPKIQIYNHLTPFTDPKGLLNTVPVDKTFSFHCLICDWSTEVVLTNSVTLDEIHEIYTIKIDNGD